MPQCQWDNGNCQVPADIAVAQEYEGQYFCYLHSPQPEGPGYAIPESLRNWLLTQSEFRSYRFPAASYVLECPKAPNFSSCIFVAGCEIELPKMRCTFVDCSFGIEGESTEDSQSDRTVRIYGKLQTGLVISKGTINQTLLISSLDPDSTVEAVRFSEVTAHAEIYLKKISVSGFFSLEQSTLHAPLVCREICLPQASFLTQTRFKTGAIVVDAESSYRSLRTVFADHKNRELEGLFYALEKRCHRLSLPWWSLHRAAWAVYDFASEYGQNYLRPLLWLAATQLMFGLFYAWMLDRLFHTCCVDGPLTIFTLVQLVKPFDAAGGKLPSNLDIDTLSTGELPWFIVVTMLQGVASLALIALFLLALRWRFRRE
jgi:hypothetical protein